jgi:hypothetical protein
MLMTKERRPAIRTLRGWAISVLQEAGSICECEEHGWMRDRADPACSATRHLLHLNRRRIRNVGALSFKNRGDLAVLTEGDKRLLLAMTHDQEQTLDVRPHLRFGWQ